MDDRAAAGGAARRDARHPPLGGSDGPGESHLGLPSDPGGLAERRTSRRPLDGRHDPPCSRDLPGPGAADVMGHVSGSTLERHCRCGFLCHGGVDRPRTRHVLHAVRDRPRVAASASPGIHTASKRCLRSAGRSRPDQRRRRCAYRSSPAHLRPGHQMEPGVLSDPGGRRDPRGPDTLPGAQLQCLRRALRSIN